MARSRITYLRGREWWLCKTDKLGRNIYPRRIVVGDPERGRVYVPVEEALHDGSQPEHPAECED